jgi:hypothetical protein
MDSAFAAGATGCLVKEPTMPHSEAAAQLRISPTTVKSHVSNALTKLGARNRVQAVLLVRAVLAPGVEVDAGVSPAQPVSRARQRPSHFTTRLSR